MDDNTAAAEQAAPEPLIHLSQLCGAALVSAYGDRVGAVVDVTALIEDEHAPITGAIADIAGLEMYVPANQIAELSPLRLVLTGSQDQCVPLQDRPREARLRKHLLDKKLINLREHRLVRANEIVLMKVDGWYEIAGVDTGPRGFLRRLVPRRLANRVHTKGFTIWADLEPLPDRITEGQDCRHPRLHRLHPAELADLIEQVGHAEGDKIIGAVHDDRNLEADLFEALDRHHQLEFITERSNAAAADLLARMQPDAATDLLAEIQQPRRSLIINLLPPPLRHDIWQLLGNAPTTAGGLMTPRFVCVYARASKAEAIARLEHTTAPADTLTHLYVMTEHRRLRGAIPLPDLLRADPQRPLTELAQREPVKVHSNASLEELARLMADYNLAAIPVVDDKQRMIGVVTYADVLQLLLPKTWRRRFDLFS